MSVPIVRRMGQKTLVICHRTFTSYMSQNIHLILSTVLTALRTLRSRLSAAVLSSEGITEVMVGTLESRREERGRMNSY